MGEGREYHSQGFQVEVGAVVELCSFACNYHHILYAYAKFALFIIPR